VPSGKPERLETIAPGRLSARLREGLSGHHPLFDPSQIRAAFEGPDRPMGTGQARRVGEVLLAIAREPLGTARLRIASLDSSSREALVRLYFRLLDRAAGERPSSH
jgi:hypothetical protein